MKRNLSPIQTLVRELIPLVGSFAPGVTSADIAFDTGTGNFIEDEIVTGGTSAAVGKVTAVRNTNGTLDYDAQSGNFVEAEIVTGGTSGATGVVVSDTDGGTDGTLVLSGVVGEFLNDEDLIGSVSGEAVVDGELAATAGVLSVTDIIGTFVNNEAITGDGDGDALVNGAPDYAENAPTDLKGLGFTVEWTAPGVFTVVLADGYNSLVSCKALFQSATAAGKMCQAGVIDVVAKTFQIRIWDNVLGAPKDVEPDAGTRVNFVCWLRASAAKPEYG